MRIVDVGGFVYDDIESALVILFRDGDGVVVNFTGATLPTLVCERLDGSDPFTIAGSIFGAATGGYLRFPAVAQGPAEPNIGQRVVYRGIPKWKASGATEYSWAHTEFRFSVTRYPSA